MDNHFIEFHGLFEDATFNISINLGGNRYIANIRYTELNFGGFFFN